MPVFSIRLCLPVFFFVCVVSISVTQGRNLRRRHSHHSHLDYPISEESVPRDLTRRFEDDMEYQRYPYRRQMERRESSRVLDHPVEYEERISPPRRYKHVNNLRTFESLRKDEISRPEDIINDVSTRHVVRGKRHNRHGSTVSYQSFSDQDRLELEMNRQRKFERTSTTGGLRASYEMEVKEAQNSSICSYTVESIPDTRGTRMPRDLEHVRCNNAGSSCLETGSYCCIQTYRYIEVSYSDGEDSEKMKIYVGCVCALQELNTGLSLVQSEVGIDD